MKEKNRSFSALKMALAVAFAAIASPVMAEDIDADLNKSTTLLNGETPSNNLTSALNSEVGNDDLLTQNGINSSGTTILPNGETLQLSLDGIDTGVDNSKNISTNNLTSAKTPSKTTSTRMVAKLTSPVKLANTPTVYTPTLDRVNATSSTIINDTEGLRPTYELVTSKPSGAYVSVNINNTTYYYVPDTTTYKLSDLQNLANTGSAALSKVEVGTGVGTPVYTDGTYDYFYDTAKLPTSGYDVTAGSATDYNFVTYTKDEEGKTVPNYYKIALGNRIGTSENITWSTDGTGATGSVSVQLPNETTARKLYYTVDESKYGKLHTTTADRVINPTSDVGSADSPDLFKGIAYSSGGGAISNTANNNKNIYGDFIGNSSSYHGGAIYNTGKLNNIIGDFINNASKQTYRYGGAIYSNNTVNNIIGDFIGNSSYDLGGAIANEQNGVITNITGNFISNSCTGANMGKGGALHNSYAKIGTITGDFIGNYTDWLAGAISNIGTIDYITGDFIGNYLLSGSTNGGAIVNYAGGKIGDINGDFIGNSSTPLGSGGAIYLEVSIVSNITGDFICNHAGWAGAIGNNNGTIDNITGDFVGNYSQGSTGRGGAINNYNSSTIGNITGNFIDNYAQGSTAHGGAIYNESGTITLNANTQDILFSGNWVGPDAEHKTFNDIYNQNSSATKLGILNLTSSNGHKISFDGGITGNGTTNVADGTTLAFTNAKTTFEQGSINIQNAQSGASQGVIIDLMNGTTQDFSIKGLVLNSDTKLSLNLDFLDQINGTASGAGLFDITSINLANISAGVDSIISTTLSNYFSEQTFGNSALINKDSSIGKVKLVIEDGNVILRTSLKDITPLGTLDKIYDASEGIINDPSRTTYTLSSDKTEGSVALRIDVTTKYFTPTSDVEKWQNLANTGNVALSKVEVGTGIGTPVYTDGTYDYFYDTAKLPTSVYELAKGTSTDYNFIKYTKSESGELVPNYYKIELDGSRLGTSENITWSTNPTGSTNPNNPIEVQLPNPTKEGGTETISLYYTLNNDTYTKLLNGKTGTSKNITWSNDGTGATGSVEVQLLNEASKRTLYYKVDESKYGNVWKEHKDNPDTIGSADKPDLFIGASSSSNGGAIYNTANNNINIYADFVSNSSSGYGYGAGGGAIANYTNYYSSGATVSIGNITGDFIGNSAGSGGAIYNYASSDTTASIGNITGDFIGNSATDSGGAIHNWGDYDDATIGDITGDFIGNHAGSNGGAIYNYASYGTTVSIGNITGDFIGNSAGSNGGAIYNGYYSTIGDITGDFIGNSAFYGDYFSGGGAIFNGYRSSIGSITGDFIGNSGGSVYNEVTSTINSIDGDFIGNSSGHYGSAIQNYGKINSITGDFVGNSVASNGGAIFNSGGEIGSITGDFIGNSGGAIISSNAIYSAGTIGSINGDFIGNSGGAIYNDNNNKINSITGDFIGNSDGYTIYNYYGTIGSITGDFIGNTGYSTIENMGSIDSITGNFIGNSGSTVIETQGHIGSIKGDFIDNTGSFLAGAIIVVNPIDNIEGNFIRNTGYGGAIDNEGYAIKNITADFIDNHGGYGGAICNWAGGDITLNADTQDVLFSGNWIGTDEANKTYNDILNNIHYSATDNALNLTSSNGHKISFDGGITGDGVTNILAGTAVEFTNANSTFQQGKINIGDGAKVNIQNKGTQIVDNIALGATGETVTMDIDFYDKINGTSDGGMININTIDVTGVGVGATNELTTSLANYIANSSWSGAKLVGEVGIDAVTFSKNGDVGILSAVTANFGDIIVNTFGKDKAAFQMSQDETLATALTTNSAAGHPATYELTINGKDAQTGTNHSISGTGIIVANGTTLNLGDVTFSGMSADKYGGAIYNNAGNTLNLTNVNFNNNTAGSDSAVNPRGGAIYNNGTIGDITGDFTENKTTALRGGDSGAIYNNGTIGNITGTFSSNSTTAKIYSPHGGAIYNTGTIDSITGTEKIIDGKTVNVAFINNYAKTQSGAALGGAILNTSTIGTITGDFIGNYACSTGSGSTMQGASGGAIDNTGTIENIVDSNFVNNYSQGYYKTYSGAIRNTANGTITITSLNKDVTFSGNYSADETGSNKAYNDIVNKNILNLASSEGHKISFDGGILGDIDDATLGTTNIADGTTLAFTNAKTTFEQGTINIQNAQSGENKGVVIDLMNGTTQDFSIKGLVLNTDTKLNLNVDLLDQINGTASGAGKINIATINVSGVTAGTTNVLTTSLANYINNTTWSGSQLANNFETDIKSVTLDKATGTFTAVGLTFAEALRNELPKAERNYKLLSGETLASGISTNSASGHPAKYTLNVDGNNQTVTGKGFTVSSGTTLSLKDMTFDNMTASKGGAIYVANGGKIDKIENVTFSNNSSTSDGGAIYNNSGTIDKLENVTFLGNTDKDYGGAIYNKNGTINSITGLFKNNKSVSKYSGYNTYAGAIANAENATIKSIKADFIGNSASWGAGAIMNSASGEITSIEGDFTENTSPNAGGIINYGHIGTIEGNFTSNISTQGAGGAICTSIQFINSVKIDKIIGDFKYNSSGDAGGAIFVQGTIGNIIDSNFIGNYARNNGGAIFSDNAKTTVGITTLNDNVTFEGNYITNSDGTFNRYNDIYNNGGTINLNAAAEKKISFGGSIEGSNGILNINNLIYDTVVDAEGHEVQVARPTDGSVVFNDVVTGNQINLYNGTVEINKEGEFAPTALNVEGGKINIQNGKNQTVKNINVKLTSGTVDMDIDFFDKIEGSSQGGKIDIKTINLTGVKNCEQNVLTESLGQAIYNTGWSGAQLLNPGSINAVGLSVDNKKATLTAYDTLSLESAIVNINKENSMLFTMDKNVELANAYTTNSIGKTPAYQLTINGKDKETGENHTISGTGIVVANNTTLDLADVTFSGMSAANKGDGGAINGNVRTIGAGTKFINNTAGVYDEETKTIITAGNGGAINGSVDTIGAGSTFINNSAYSWGGVIYGSVNEIKGTDDNHVVFQENKAYSYTVQLESGVHVYNGCGGAILNIEDENITTIENTDFIRNYAGVNGGAIYNNGTTNSINGNFIGNSATGNGGAICNNSTIYNIEGNFNSNYADGGRSAGGAISNAGTITNISGNFEHNYLSGGTAISNTHTGGAIYNSGTIDNISGSNFTGNYIEEGKGIGATGGAICNMYGGYIGTITADFVENYVSKTSTTLSGTAYGGAIFNTGSNINNIIDSNFIDNYAKGSKPNGGAIHNINGSIGITAKTKDVTFSGNYVTNLDDSNKLFNDIYNSGTINLNAATEKKISFGGSVEGTNGILNINNLIYDTVIDEEGHEVQVARPTDGSVIFNGNISGNNINIYNGNVEFKQDITVSSDKIDLVAGKLDNAGNITGEVKVHDGANLVSSGNVGSILNSGNVQIAANAKITGNYSGYNGSSLDIQNGVLDTIKVATLEDSYLKFDVNLLSFESDKLNFNGASTGAHISFGEQAINLLAEMDEDVSIGKFQLATAGIITDKYTIASQDATYIFAESTVSDSGWINVTKDGGVSLSKYIQQLEEESAESGTKVEGQYDLKADMYTTKDIGTLQLAGLILNGTENKKGITSEGKKGITLNGDDASLRVENLGHATGFVGGFVDNKNGSVTIANSNISGNADVDIINNDLLVFEGNNNIGVVNNSGNAIVNSVKTEITGGLNANGSVVINENAELAFIGDATLEQNNVLVNKDGKLSVDNASKMNVANLTNEGEFNVNGGKITTDVNGEGNLNVNGDVTNEKIITNNVNIAENKSLQNDGTITGNTFNKGTLKSNVNNIQAVDNTGDYFVSGEGNIAAAITGQTGTTHIEENSNITNNNAVNIENAISISENAKLTSNANNILNKVTLADNSSYNITGGKINAEIVGDGITNILENSTVALAETINLSGRVVAHNGSTFDIMNGAANTVSQFEVASGAKMNLNLDIEDKIDGTPTDGTINLAKINLAKAVAPGDRYQITDTLASNMKFSADTELLNKDENINFLTFSKDNGKGTIVALQTTLDKALEENNGDSAFFTMQDNEILSVAKAIGGEIGGNFVIDGKGNNIIGGGIIVNKNKTLEMKDANFVNASTEGSEDAKAAITVKGGSSASIIAQNSNVVITGTNNGKAVALESDGGNSKVTIEAKENQKVVLDDGITSDNKDNIVDFNGAGTIIFNGEFDNATSNVNAKVERGNYDNNISYNINEGGHLHYTSDLYLYDPSLHGKEYGLNSINMNGGALDLRNDAASRIELQELTVSTPSDLYLDVDLAALAIDNFGDTPVMASESGKLHIAGLNLVSDATLENTTISFTDNPTLMSITDYTGSDTVYAPVYKYNVNYNSSVGDFNFQKLGGGVTPDPTPTPVPYNDLNPGVMNSAVAAQVGAYSTVLSTFQESFSRMDMAMAMPLKERRAIRMRNKYSATGNVTTFDPNQFPEERQGIWFTPYTSYEKVDLKNGPNVENFTYGGLVGYDSKLIELKNGWDAIFTGFAGYNGSRQAFDGVNSYLNGGTLGATAVFYKDNFFTGLTANVGASNVETTSPTAKDDFALLSAGIASKTGYNWELADGKFIIQPSLQLAYTFINAFDHTNSAGVRITSDPLNTIQIAPGIKFIGNLSNGWQPYAGIQMVWNIMDTVKSQADGINLPETSTRPYLQYGVGVQKHWGDRCTGYIQTGIRNGGRTGIAVSGGFRWALGPSPSDNTKKSNVNLKTRRTIQLSSF